MHIFLLSSFSCIRRSASALHMFWSGRKCVSNHPWKGNPFHCRVGVSFQGWAALRRKRWVVSFVPSSIFLTRVCLYPRDPTCDLVEVSHQSKRNAGALKSNFAIASLSSWSGFPQCVLLLPLWYFAGKNAYLWMWSLLAGKSRRTERGFIVLRVVPSPRFESAKLNHSPWQRTAKEMHVEGDSMGPAVAPAVNFNTLEKCEPAFHHLHQMCVPHLLRVICCSVYLFSSRSCILALKNRVHSTHALQAARICHYDCALSHYFDWSVTQAGLCAWEGLPGSRTLWAWVARCWQW